MRICSVSQIYLRVYRLIPNGRLLAERDTLASKSYENLNRTTPANDIPWRPTRSSYWSGFLRGWNFAPRNSSPLFGDADITLLSGLATWPATSAAQKPLLLRRR